MTPNPTSPLAPSPFVLLPEATGSQTGHSPKNQTGHSLEKHTADWVDFHRKFREAYPLFLERLLEKYPSLTPVELKICALLRAALSSSEIAVFLNCSARTVDNHRYRLRKKLRLKAGEKLMNVLHRVEAVSEQRLKARQSKAFSYLPVFLALAGATALYL